MMFMIIKLIFVLIGMAFLTLLERKFLGYVQLRKGPNKISFVGLLQPVADAVKLMGKNKQSPYLSWYMVFYISPVVMLLLSVIVWLMLVGKDGMINVYFNLTAVVVFLSVGVYFLLSSGWVSNSKYSFLGAFRGIAQTISYEVVFIFVFLISLVGSGVYCSKEINTLSGGGLSWWVLLLVVLMVWYVSCLAETNRAPFDFAEGESELVSGFNIEYSSFEFAMLFMAEYTFILFMCMLTSMLFMSAGYLNKNIVMAGGVSLFIFSRGAYPRFRYDQLMMMAWKSFLILVMVYLIGVGWLI